jgi:hypothetical protein
VNGSDHTRTDAVELVAAADAAMYRSKRRGHGSPVITRELDERQESPAVAPPR